MEQKLQPREEAYFVLSSLAHVVVVVLLGVFLNVVQIPVLPAILAFAVCSKVFALVIGENKRFFAHSRWASVPLAILSLVILLFLPLPEIVLGILIMILYVCYPHILKAREKSPLDIIFHGARYALLFWMAYSGRADLLGFTAASMVFLFGVAGELLVGLRASGEGWTTTASRLGVRRTVRVVNLLSVALIILGSAVFSEVIDFPLITGTVSIPVPLILGVFASFFIMQPAFSVGGSRHAAISVRKRELIVILLCAALFIGLPLGTRDNFSQTAPQPNYTVVVGMQTIVTGPNTWDGQWIIFNYASAGNFYYVLLHTNGTLELARYVNGVPEPHLDDVNTSYSPFKWHQYKIQVLNGVATVSIDGRAVMHYPIQNPGGEVWVTQSFPHKTIWVVVVTQFQVSAAG